MSKELTEKWRNGTLKEGAYYILVDKYEQNEPEIDVGICYNSNFEWWIVKEVLAPVPTYEEWVKTGTWYTEKSHNELLKKIEKLERRLKEAEKVIKFYADAQPLTEEEKQMSAEKYHLVYGLKANDYLEKYGVKND